MTNQETIDFTLVFVHYMFLQMDAARRSESDRRSRSSWLEGKRTGGAPSRRIRRKLLKKLDSDAKPRWPSVRIPSAALWSCSAFDRNLYLGEINHRDKSYPGEHAPIIDPRLFEAVQAKLTENRQVPSRYAVMAS